jgi:hypothetical protein
MDLALHRPGQAHIAVDMKFADQAIVRAERDPAPLAGRVCVRRLIRR